MKKRILSLLCVLALLMGLVPAASALEGEAQRAAKTLADLHLLAEVPSEEALKTPATRLQATDLLVRLYGVNESKRAVSAQEYASTKGWVTVTGGQKEAVPTAEFCANLLRQMGYEGFTNENADVFARRIGLTARDYDSPLTMGDLCQLARDALTFPDKKGVTPAKRMLDGGVCTQAQYQSLFPETLTVRQVADRHMAAIVRLDVYYSEKEFEEGASSNGGSGFFVSPDGLVVTNCHTVEGAVRATASLVTGEVFEVERVLFYDEDADLALLRISQTSLDGKTTAPLFHCLELAEEPDLRVGDQVYSLGVPLGVTLSAGSGVISAVNHKVNNESFSTLPCVISTADISHGSSGGALLNVFGHVVGVTTGAYTNGNNLYLSIPLALIMEADWEAEGTTLQEIAELAAAQAKEKKAASRSGR